MTCLNVRYAGHVFGELTAVSVLHRARTGGRGRLDELRRAMILCISDQVQAVWKS